MTEDHSELSRRDLFTGVFQRFREAIHPNVTSTLPDPKLKEQANTDFAAQLYAQAAPVYEKYLLGQPHDLDARRRLALCLYRQEKFVQSRMECSRVLYDHKNDDFALLLLGLANLRMNRTEKAVSALEKFTGDTKSSELIKVIIAKLPTEDADAHVAAVQALEPLLILPQESLETTKVEASLPPDSPGS